MKICVADDEQRVRESIVHKLRGCHPYAEVFDVGFGQEALERIVAVRPDLLFVDIRMPELDGLSILQEAKRLRPMTEAIVLTGYEDFDYARTALQRGALDYMLKPADREQLRQRVARVYEGMSARFAEQVGVRLRGDAGSGIVRRDGNLSLWFDERAGKTVRFRESGEEAEALAIGSVRNGDVEADIVPAASWPSGTVFFRPDEFPGAWEAELGRWQDRRFYGRPPASGAARLHPYAVPPEAAAARRQVLLAAKKGDRERLNRSAADWLGALEGIRAEALKRECEKLLNWLDEGLFAESPASGLGSRTEDRAAELAVLRTWPELRGWMLKALDAYLPPRPVAATAWDEVLGLLENGEGPGLSLEEAASRLGVHPVTFSRLFKQRVGVPFVRYMVERRMQRARLLLLAGNDPVADVAEAVGYADLRYFGSLFKQAFGMTPGEYRRLHGTRSGGPR
ncbi:response regulator transcription factor [Cohnella zeiphila]|uniref:Helix-turn-helix domain-containing protein n=1 Tax=Cohnella zeiphila TaxID=2761120 RepID=A0A7X0SSX9_9BACL|nr:helix-turn-helix domain-containing protein [Cohnella zeiphila]MBB6735416.1 helix-turn-helix domain-containing protein [Cohnella zeiphila]